MIETLYKFLGKAPVVGQPITLAYISNRVQQSVRKTQDRKLDPETAKLAGGQLESELKKQANDIYSADVQPLVAETGVPDALVKPLKDKAIAELTKVMREQIQKQLTTKETAPQA